MKYRRIAAFIVMLCMVINMLPYVHADASTEVAGGTLSEGMSWSLSDTGMLTISGTGAMEDYTSSSPAPWYDYRSQITAAVIADGVTTVGAYAFCGCTAMTAVTIADSVTRIGSYAFLDCTGLTELTIPDSVTRIGYYPLSGCSGLEALTIPFVGDQVKTSSDTYQYPLGYIFGITSYDGGVATRQLYQGESPIGNSVYYIPAGLRSVTVTGGNILYGAFYNCSSLTSITLPEGITAIGEYAFYNCTGLTSVAIPDSVTTLSSRVFYECSGLTDVTISANVTDIGNEVCYGCSSLKGIWVHEDNPNYCNDASGLLFNKGKTEILQAPGSLSGHYTVPAGVTQIGKYAFRGCKQLGSVTICDGVTTIDEQAFRQCSGLTSIRIPDSVTKINTLAFYYCSALAEVTYCGTQEQWDAISISSNNDALTAAARQYHDWLDATCTAPKTCDFCGATEGDALGHSWSDATCTTPKTCTVCGATEGDVSHSWAEATCTVAKTCTICGATEGEALGHTYEEGTCTVCGTTEPETVCSHVWADGVCTECGITGGICGDNVTWTLVDGTLTISGTGAMYDYDGNTTYAPWYKGYFGQSDITAAVIEDGVTTIADYAFYRCTDMVCVSIPDSVTSIGEFSFYYCSSLTEMMIPAGVTDIGLNAFAYTRSLERIDVDENNEYFSSDSSGVLFDKDKTYLIQAPGSISGSYTIPDTVVSTRDMAFMTCQELTSVTIPASLTSLGVLAFLDCTALTGIWVDENNPNYSSDSSGVLFNKDKTLLIVAPGGITGDYAIPAGVTTIESSAFNCCSQLSSVSMPASVTTIGYSVFSQCTSLTGIWVDENNPNYSSDSSGVFFNKNKTELLLVPKALSGSYTIPDSITDIGTAFRDCIQLTEVVIPDSVTSIGGSAFSGCYNLTTIALRASMTEIGDWVFTDCYNLTTVIYCGSEDQWNAITIAEGNDELLNAQRQYHDMVDGVCSICGGTECDTSGHSWTDATCTAPKTCTICGTTEGEALGHNWVDATCTAPKSCTICGATEGEALGHNWADATCTAPKTCTICGATEGESLGHDWVGGSCIVAATCSVCGKVEDKATGDHLWANGACEVCGITGGTCGDDVFWFLQDGTLTISGTGEMKEYTAVSWTPWYEYRDEIVALEVTDGVTRIRGVFGGYTNLATVVLADSVIYMHANPFSNTAWYNAQPDGVVYAGKIACHYKGTCPEQITIREGTLSIAEYAFKDNTELTAINLPAGMVHIGANAFYKCTGLTEVTIPEGVTHIGNAAFYQCTGLTSVSLPGTLIEIGNTAFYGCTGLTELTIPDGTTTIGSQAFDSCSNLSSITVPDSVMYVRHEAFHDTAWYNSIIAGTVYVGKVAYDLKYRATCPTKATIKAGTIAIADYAFEKLTKLTTVVIPESITYIGENAFYGCSALTSVTIPEGVSQINPYTFYGCSSMTTVTIPRSVTTIGKYAFSSCSSLTTVIYCGTQESWDAIKKVTSDTALLNAQMQYHDWSAAACGAAKTCTICGVTEFAAYGDHVWADGVCTACGVTGGVCGEDLNWILLDGVLTIGGTGAMYDAADCNSTPWRDYRFEITQVIIEEGVTTIGHHAFEDCEAITAVTIPDGITSVGDHAFRCCSSLLSVTIPDGVTYLGWDAFFGCSKMTDIKLPVGITEIKYGTFCQCEALTELVIPAGVQSIDVEAVTSCPSLTTVALPDSLTAIGDDVFVDCENLTKVIFCGTPEQWDAITVGEGNEALHAATLKYHDFVYFICTVCGANAGSAEDHVHTWVDGVCTDCNVIGGLCDDGLTWVLMNGALTISGTGEMMDYAAGTAPWYAYRDSITSIVVASDVTRMGAAAFFGLGSLEAVTIPFVGERADLSACVYQHPLGYIFGNTSYDGGEETKQYRDELSTGNSAYLSYYIPTTLKSVTILGGSSLKGAFYNCGNLTAIDLPEGLTAIDSVAFYYCSSLETLRLPETVTHIGASAFNNCKSLTQINLPDGITDIDYFAFHGCSALDGITLPSSLKTIGMYAFAECTILTGLDFPEGLESIGRMAFCNCKSLTGAVLPDSVTTVGDSAFIGCSSISQAAISRNLNTIEDNLFNGCYSLTEIVIPDNIAEVGGYAFCGCSSLETVSIEYGITKINTYAFAGCSSLTQINVPESVTYIGADAFNGCSSLTQIVIPDSVTEISYNAFYNCRKLESIEIGNSVTSIGKYAFFNCLQLTQITLPDTITTIGTRAFYSCQRLTSITIPAGITNIGDYAFALCDRLTTVTIRPRAQSADVPTRNTVATVTGTSIDEYAFYNCTQLVEVNIPSTVTSIGDYAFDGCTNLTTVTYCGTQEQWSAVSIGTNNAPLSSAELQYHAWTEATCEAPKTCTICGATEGESLGHSWVDATCEAPKTCTTCGETEGEALGHTWAEATCETAKSCTACGETEGEALGHTFENHICFCGMIDDEQALIAAIELSGDGKVTVFDAQILAEAKAGLRTLTDEQWALLGSLSPDEILNYVLGRYQTAE